MLSALLGRWFGRKVCALWISLFFFVLFFPPSKSHFLWKQKLPFKNLEWMQKPALRIVRHRRRRERVAVSFLGGGIMLLIYQCDNRPILITPGYATIICHCQTDQACANQALGLTQLNRQPIDYFSYLSHCMRRDTRGNRANGRGLKVTLFTSPMTREYVWGEIRAAFRPTPQHVWNK